MAFLIWLFVHLYFLYWFLKSNRDEKSQVAKQWIIELKENPAKTIVVIFCILSIEAFVLGIMAPAIFIFMVPTPFGDYPSWGVGLCCSLAAFVLMQFID